MELGLAAFAPAYALLAVRLRDSWWWLAFAAPAALGVIVLLAGALIVRKGNAEAYDFGDVEDLSDEVLGHIGAYLLPALVDSSASGEQSLMAWLTLLLIVQVHIATGRVYVNPLLYIVGRRVYSATIKDSSFYLVAKSDVADWTVPTKCVQLGESMLIERSK